MTTLITLVREAVEAIEEGSSTFPSKVAALREWLDEHDAWQTEYAGAIQAARDQYHVDGEVEIDDTDVMVSPGEDPGVYVSAWVWVDIPEEEE